MDYFHLISISIYRNYLDILLNLFKLAKNIEKILFKSSKSPQRYKILESVISEHLLKLSEMVKVLTYLVKKNVLSC
jgi:hypothetical protein